MVDGFPDFNQLLTQYLPWVVLFLLLSVGYSLAMNDFKPKKAEKEGNSSPDRRNNIVPVTRSRELSNAELGISDIDDTAALSSLEQRHLKMEKIIREFSTQSPEETAGVIKGWLNER